MVWLNGTQTHTIETDINTQTSADGCLLNVIMKPCTDEEECCISALTGRILRLLSANGFETSRLWEQQLDIVSLSMNILKTDMDSWPEMSNLQRKLKEISNTCFKQSRSVRTSLFDHSLRSELILNITRCCEINSSESYRLETAHTHIDRCCLLWQIRPLLKLKVVKAALEVCRNSISCSPQYTGIRPEPGNRQDFCFTLSW